MGAVNNMSLPDVQPLRHMASNEHFNGHLQSLSKKNWKKSLGISNCPENWKSEQTLKLKFTDRLTLSKGSRVCNYAFFRKQL